MPHVRASCNPFRSRRLEQLPFRSPRDGAPFDWARFLAEFQALRGRERGAVVGPHGSGKTTFLVELQQRLAARGREVVMLFTNRDGGGRMPDEWVGLLRATGEETLVIADGYDALGVFSRLRLRRVLRPRGGLIVTAHRRCTLPTLLETATSPRLLESLLDDLCAGSRGSFRPSEEWLAKLYRSCRGNLREVLRRLYNIP